MLLLTQIQILVRHVPVADFEAMEGDTASTDLFIVEGQDAFEKRAAATAAAKSASEAQAQVPHLLIH